MYWDRPQARTERAKTVRFAHWKSKDLYVFDDDLPYSNGADE